MTRTGGTPLFFFAPDDPPAADPPAADPPAADPPADKTFTQAELDRIVQDRLARAKTTPPADYEELKAAAAKLAELEEANKSELEKAQAKAEKALKDSEAAIERANKRLIEAAILAEASAAKAIKPEHMHRLIDTGSVTVGDDGQVTGVKEAVEGFLKANPEYVGTGGASGSADLGARSAGGNQLGEAALKSMSPEAIDKAHREGRFADLLGASKTK